MKYIALKEVELPEELNDSNQLLSEFLREMVLQQYPLHFEGAAEWAIEVMFHYTIPRLLKSNPLLKIYYDGIEDDELLSYFSFVARALTIINPKPATRERVGEIIKRLTAVYNQYQGEHSFYCLEKAVNKAGSQDVNLLIDEYRSFFEEFCVKDI